MKYCEKGHENKDEARFCRICGSELSNVTHSESKIMHPKKSSHKEEGFTLSKFSHINLLPTSQNFFIPIRSVLLGMLFIAIVAIVITALIVDSWRNEDIAIPIGIFAVVLLIIAWLIPYFRFRSNAVFLEQSPENIKRIAKKCKLGLYRTDKKEVLLKSKYDDIQKVDGIHYVISRKGKYGVYSLTRKKIIVPVRYEKVHQPFDGIWSGEKGGETVYYNYSGKIVK